MSVLPIRAPGEERSSIEVLGVVLGGAQAETSAVLSPEALDFVAGLQRRFNRKRKDLLKTRFEKQERWDGGERPDFLPETREIRESDWRTAPCPRDLEDRRVEITGPAEPKMMINALNSGARVFMADFEDSLSPTWENVLQGQQALREAVRRTLAFENPDGKVYRLNDRIATLLVRPRGWHLDEKHVRIDGEPVSASLFDFGLCFFHNARELIRRGTGPYFYLPKLESHLEARLWNDVFDFAQDALGIPRGTIRATVLIETILAAFEMDEILYELRDHVSGINAGRWDYIFSIIKKFRNRPDMILPDRALVSMTVPFMRAYTELLVKTAHRRGAHAMGGMSAFIPSRKDAEVNRVALAKVREDKEREATDGFDGTWVAHPDLVPVATEIFDRHMGRELNQKSKLRDEVRVSAGELLDFRIAGGFVSERGLRTNIEVGIQYLERWLSGVGAVAIHHLMEDAATAEISRAQVWQWLHHRVSIDGENLKPDFYRRVFDEELELLGGTRKGKMAEAAELFDRLIVNPGFSDFLTVPAYERLDGLNEMEGRHAV